MSSEVLFPGADPMGRAIYEYHKFGKAEDVVVHSSMFDDPATTSRWLTSRQTRGKWVKCGLCPTCPPPAPSLSRENRSAGVGVGPESPGRPGGRGRSDSAVRAFPVRAGREPPRRPAALPQTPVPRRCRRTSLRRQPRLLASPRAADPGWGLLLACA